MKRIIDVVKSFAPPFMKRAIKKGSRELSGQIGVMPDYIIIGAQKCGTTSLYRYLIKHPCVVPASKKEVHFFDNHFGEGISWYRAHFPSFLYRYYAKQMRRQDIITGEASPYYICHPLAPKRISEIIPRVKLIALLRNPVDRAYSHYHHEVKNGNETLSFEEAIKREEERLRGERDRMLRDEDYYSFNHQHYSYLSRGIYVDQLKVWMSIFPKEQVLILESKDFFADPPTILKRVFEFLNLPSWELKEYRKYNIANYSKIDTTMRKCLIDYFEPHNQRLYEYLGVNLGWDR